VARGQSLPLTTISDVVYEADGSAAQGTLLISWPEFTTSGGLAVAAGTSSVTLGAGGALSAALVPNVNATPPNSVYTVVYQLSDGTVRTEFWIVPTTSPATLAEMRTTLGTSGTAAQLATQQFVTTAVSPKANDSAVVHLAGSETITGTKQFSVAPSLPNPVQPGDAANKQYVDTSVQNVGSGNYLSLSGGTMSGALTLSGDPVAPEQAATKHYSDLWAAVKADLIAGLVPAAELGSGTPDSATCLLGNQTWGPCSASGTGSVYVNTALIASPNFNATTPGPQSNFLNCTFQGGSGTVSLECPYGSSSSAFALGSEAVLNNQTNAFSTGLQDFSLAQLKLPSGAGFEPAANGEIGFDTTANLPVIAINGVTQQIALTTSNTSGQASTALALAGTPAQCNGSFATGIQANGNANCSVADVIELAETTPPNGIPNYGIFWFDSATHTPRVIDNNGQVVQLGLVNVFNSDANTLEEYNGTTPQTFNLYGTRTDASDYERLRMAYDTTDGYFLMSADAAGTGTQRGLGFGLQGSLRWVIDSSFNFKPWSDNIKDIGTPTLRLKHLYLGTYADLTSGAVVTEIPNAGVTGTALNQLAKLTGAPATAILASTSDTTGIIGVVVDGAGTTGNAQIARGGQALCVFDGATVPGDYVQISSAVAGDCDDAGATLPSSGEIIGRVLSTNATAGTFAMVVAGSENRSGSLPSMNPGGSLVAASSSSVATTVARLDASQFSGADAFAQVNACVAALPAGGGKCDASNLPAANTVSTNLVISKANVEVDWGASTFTMGSSTTITISGSGDNFNCLHGVTTFVAATNTGSGVAGQLSGAIMTLESGSNIRTGGCVIEGNRLASGDIYDGANGLTAQSVPSGLLLEDLTITNAGGNGIQISNSDNWVVQRVYVAQSSAPGINVNSTTGSTPYLGYKIIRDSQFYDNVTAVGACGVGGHTAWCTTGGGPGGGTIPTGNYEVNVLSSVGYGYTRNLRFINNTIANGYIGGGSTTAGSCTGWNGSSGSSAYGCLGGFQLSNTSDYEVANNTVRNTQAECVAVGYTHGHIHHNNLSLCATATDGTIPNNGSGGVSFYVASADGSTPGIPTTQGFSEIDHNLCVDCGYVVQLVLGQTNNNDSMVLSDLTVDHNIGQVLNQALKAGIHVRNATTNNTPCGGETPRACNWTITNSNISGNDFSAANTPWVLDTTGLTDANGWTADGPAGFLGSSPVAQIPLQSAAGFVSGTGSTPNVALVNSPAFTGVPTAPTAAVNDDSIQIATDAFVLGQAASATPNMDGTAGVGTSLTWARADHVHPSDTSRAPLASPAFTGTPTAPTPAAGDSSTKIATTAYVQAQTTSLPWFTQPFSNGNGIALSASTNKAYLYGVVLNYAVSTTQVTYYVATADNTSNTYDIGIYQGASGITDSQVTHIGSTAGTTFAPSTGWKTLSWTGAATLQPGRYYLAITSSCTSSCAQLGSGSTTTGLTFDFNNSLGITTGGTLPSSITGPSDSYAVTSIPVWSVH
jgi:hypothetical protein